MSSSPYATLYALGLVVPAVLQHVRADPVPQLRPTPGWSSPPCWRTTCRARSTVIQHITLEKTWCRGARRASQRPWSGSCQRRLDRLRPSPPAPATRRRGPSRARRATASEQVGDRAEDVQLELVVGEVADPDRPGAGVPGQGVDDRLGAQFVTLHGVERVQPLGVPAGALDAAVHPAQERLGLGERAQVDQGPGGHRGVAEPAVPVVPVADAAELLRQRGGRGGQDRSGGLVAQPAQGQRAAQHQVPGDAGQLQRRRPSPATAARPRPAGRRCRRWGGRGCACRTAARRSAARRSRRGRRTARAVSYPPSLTDLPLDAGGVEGDRLGGAEHQQPVRASAAGWPAT